MLKSIYHETDASITFTSAICLIPVGLFLGASPRFEAIFDPRFCWWSDVLSLSNNTFSSYISRHLIISQWHDFQATVSDHRIAPWLGVETKLRVGVLVRITNENSDLGWVSGVGDGYGRLWLHFWPYLVWLGGHLLWISHTAPTLILAWVLHQVRSVLYLNVAFVSSRYCEHLLTCLCSVLNNFQSNGLCHDFCVANYAFAVLQGPRCWCSNYVPANPTTGCDQECGGYDTEFCGSAPKGLFGYIALISNAPSGTLGPSSTVRTTSNPPASSASSTPIDTTSSPVPAPPPSISTVIEVKPGPTKTLIIVWLFPSLFSSNTKRMPLLLRGWV